MFAECSSIASYNGYAIYLSPFPRADITKHLVLKPRVTRYPSMEDEETVEEMGDDADELMDVDFS